MPPGFPQPPGRSAHLQSFSLIEREDICSSSSSSTILCGKVARSQELQGLRLHTPLWTNFELSTGGKSPRNGAGISTGNIPQCTVPVEKFLTKSLLLKHREKFENRDGWQTSGVGVGAHCICARGGTLGIATATGGYIIRPYGCAVEICRGRCPHRPAGG